MGKFYRKANSGGYFSNRRMIAVPRHDLEYWQSLIGIKGLGFEVQGYEDGGVFLFASANTWFNGLTFFFDLSRYMRAAFWHDLTVQEGKEKQHPMLQTTIGRKAANRLFKQVAMDDGSNTVACAIYGAIKSHTKLFK